MRRLVLAMMLLCFIPAFMFHSGSAAAADAAPLTGTWQCMSHGGHQGDMAFTLSLQQDGENVTGRVSSPLGDADLSSATFKGNHLHIVINGEEATYVLEATYHNGRLSGTWTASGSSPDKGAWEGKQAEQAKP